MNSTSKNQRVAVLGAGICGLHLALSFLEKGFEVTVYSSAEETPASLASHGIICHKGYTLPRDEAFNEKLEGSYKLWKRILFLEEKTGIEIPHQKGVFEFFQTEEEAQKLRTRIYHRQLTGCFHVEFLDRKKLLEKAPFVEKIFKNSPESAYSYPGSFSFDALAYLEALRKYLEMKGVFFKEAKLKEIVRTEKGYEFLAENKKESFSSILCALGAQTDSFLEPLGLDLEPFRLSEGFTLRFSFQGKFKPFSGLVSQKNFNALKSGITVGSYPSHLLSQSCLDRSCLNKPCLDKNCLDSFHAFFPGFSEDFLSKLFSPSRVFSGTRTYTKSRKPYLRCFEEENGSKLVVLSGMYKSGFSLAEIYAERALSFF